jgi:predicted Abi (CAAX) family protease
MGRLILPESEQRHQIGGVLFEVHHAPAGYHDLVGQTVYLRWVQDREVQVRVWSVARDVYFSRTVEKSMENGLVHPVRLRGWQLVTPLESLAGAHPVDDVIVKLAEPVTVLEPGAAGETPILAIHREPVQITGRYYGLVSFSGPGEENSDLFRVTHFSRATRTFEGPEEVVRLPHTIKDSVGIFRSTSPGVEKDELNTEGWYIYGAKDSSGIFVVQALAPRALLRLQPEKIIADQKAAVNYIKKKQAWHDTPARKGRISTVLLNPGDKDNQAALEDWQEGDQALLVNTYGGIGNKREPYPYPGGFYFGHFSYGRATVIREPLADELVFDIEYYQVFSSNGDGLIPGVVHWTRYIGDRQFGYLGYRPVCDILLKLDSFTAPYEFAHRAISALDRLTTLLGGTLHLYRIGGGTGGVFFGVANNCTQDSNQVLYAAVSDMDVSFKEHPLVHDMLTRHPDEADRFDRLLTLGQALKHELLPFGAERADWRYNFHLIDTTLAESTWISFVRGLSSWRTMTPRWASDAVTQVFMKHGASAWVLRMNQVGNYDPDMVPKAIDP